MKKISIGRGRIVRYGLVLALLFSACGNKTLIDETHPFENNTWLRFNPEIFKVQVNNTDISNCVALTLRYDTAIYQQSQLPLLVDFYIDSNELHNFAPVMRLRDSKGKLRGEMVGQYCTITDTIDARRTYNTPGLYTYRIKQRTSKYEIHGINSLTLKIVEN